MERQPGKWPFWLFLEKRTLHFWVKSSWKKHERNIYCQSKLESVQKHKNWEKQKWKDQFEINVILSSPNFLGRFRMYFFKSIIFRRKFRSFFLRLFNSSSIFANIWVLCVLILSSISMVKSWRIWSRPADAKSSAFVNSIVLQEVFANSCGCKLKTLMLFRLSLI